MVNEWQSWDLNPDASLTLNRYPVLGRLSSRGAGSMRAECFRTEGLVSHMWAQGFVVS